MLATGGVSRCNNSISAQHGSVKTMRRDTRAMECFLMCQMEYCHMCDYRMVIIGSDSDVADQGSDVISCEGRGGS